jgi:hypothetical protein
MSYPPMFDNPFQLHILSDGYGTRCCVNQHSSLIYGEDAVLVEIEIGRRVLLLICNEIPVRHWNPYVRIYHFLWTTTKISGCFLVLQ